MIPRIPSFRNRCCAVGAFGALLLSAGLSPLSAQQGPAENEFAHPPDNVKPAVWWFWGESVTTNHGITQDLEALKRVGFGGVVVYEQLFTDRPGALKSLSPEWLACFRHAAAECLRLGLTLEVNVANGYVAGGPWITPELGMQRLVFSETKVVHGQADVFRLPCPPVKLGYYKDVAVLAWPSRGGSATPARKPSSLLPACGNRSRHAVPHERTKDGSRPSGLRRQMCHPDGLSRAVHSPQPDLFDANG